MLVDWQNAVYLLFIVLCIISAKAIFKWSLEFNHAKSHGVGHGDSFMFAIAGKDVTGTKGSGPAQAGYGGDAPQDGAALQNNNAYSEGPKRSTKISVSRNDSRRSKENYMPEISPRQQVISRAKKHHHGKRVIVNTKHLMVRTNIPACSDNHSFSQGVAMPPPSSTCRSPRSQGSTCTCR